MFFTRYIFGLMDWYSTSTFLEDTELSAEVSSWYLELENLKNLLIKWAKQSFYLYHNCLSDYSFWKYNVGKRSQLLLL